MTIVEDHLFNAAESLIIERRIAVTLLHSPRNESFAPLEKTMHAARAESERSLASATAMVDTDYVLALNDQKQHTLAQIEKIKKLRKDIDEAVQHEMTGRRSDLSNRWFLESTAAIQQIQKFWMSYANLFSHIDARITLQMRFKHILSSIMEYSGRERSLLGRLIVENAPVLPEDQANILRWRGSVEQGWNICAIIAEQSGLAPAITPHLKEAQSQYLTLQDMVGDDFFITQSYERSQYPISIELWFELSNNIGHSLHILKDTVKRQTAAYVEERENKARVNILINLVILLLAIILCSFSFRVIARRVLGPVHGMVEALYDVMEGKTVSQLPKVTNPHDEIGKLAEILRAFQGSQEMIKDAAGRLEAVFNTVLDGLITINSRGIIQSFNSSAERIFGYAAAEVIGHNVNILMPEPYHSQHDQYISNYLTTGDAKVIGIGREVSARRKDGTIFPMELSVNSFTLGPEFAFVGMIRDISERKAAEAEKERLISDLRRSNQELDDFAYIASHDLKEPLRGLFNNAKFLLEDYEDKLDDTGVSMLKRLGFLCQRMETLVNDLLYFSRLGRQNLAIQTTDINDVIQDIVTLMEPVLVEKDVRIEIPVPLPEVVCDKPRITEVFRNLITNAVKYNDKAEKRVEIGYIRKMTTPHGQTENVFYVKDNGIGIDSRFYADIFRIFKRLNEEDDQTKGTGVGLTFVKKIVERHGGYIWLESEVGKGTTFYFTINTL